MTSRDFLGREWDIDCMGCAIASGAMEAPGGILRRGEHFCVHQDPLIPLPGFLVIGARRHFRTLAAMQPAEYTEFARLLQETQAAIHRVVAPVALTLVQEERSHHFHFWFFPWSQSLLDRYGPPSLTTIRPIMQDYRQHPPLTPAAWQPLAAALTALQTAWPAPVLS